jgi:hypothetical protein
MRTVRSASLAINSISTSMVLASVAAVCFIASDEGLADPGLSVVRVARPTVIGFFPPVSQADLDDYSTGASSGVSHVRYALSETAKCLRQIKPIIRFVFARTVVLEVRGERITIDIPTKREQSYGAILIAPDREVRIVYAELGPSALAVALPQAAEEYFGVKACTVLGR